jgi:hypothetical protein
MLLIFIRIKIKMNENENKNRMKVKTRDVFDVSGKFLPFPKSPSYIYFCANSHTTLRQEKIMEVTTLMTGNTIP